MNEKQGKFYICRYGQTDINLCPLMDEECEFRHDCDLRQVIDYDSYQAKEQECEELRKQYNCYACGTCNGKEDYKNMQRHCEKAIAQNHNYKQALDEIEKILDNGTKDTQTNNAKWLQQHYLARFCEIRNIINKAKDGE